MRRARKLVTYAVVVAILAMPVAVAFAGPAIAFASASMGY